MPQSVEIDYLDGEFTVNETDPSTIAECVELIGETAVVDETTSNLRYRNKYPRVYRLVSKAVAEAHGFERQVKETKKNKDGTERKVYISEMDHIRAFLASNEEANRPVLQALFDEVAPAQPLYVKGERTGGGGKISQAALEAANKFFADGDEVVEEKIALIEGAVPGFKIARDTDGAATPESVARGIQALNRHLLKQAQKQAGGLLGMK